MTHVWKWMRRPITAWVLMVLLVSYLFWNQANLQKQQVRALCRSGNDARMAINERFQNLDDIFKRLAPASEGLRQFLAQEEAAKLKMRKC